MAYLYLNFFDNLTSGSRNFDDFYTQSLTEQYEGIKRRLGRNAPEDLQEFVAMLLPVQRIRILYFHACAR